MPEVLCRLCGTDTNYVASGTLLGNITVKYFECFHCSYVQTEQPNWLGRAYSDAINLTDTGILGRNLLNARIVQTTLLCLKVSDPLVVDYAGGYGILVRRLRDVGVRALWRDQYCTNLLAKGFEHVDEPADLVTAFEVLEHFVDPVSEVRRLANLGATILVSTELMPSITPRPENWWYYGLDHGQHIGFFRHKSLEFLADSLGLKLISDGKSYHLLTKKAVNSRLWLFLRRYNSIMTVINKIVRRSLTDHDYSMLLKRQRSQES